MDREDYDQTTADIIKEEYYRQFQEGNTRDHHPQLDKMAAKAAMLCKQNNWDPVLYVTAQRYNAVKKGPCFFPTYLVPFNAAENVANYTSINVRGNTWEGLWDIQKHYLKHALNRTSRTIEEILLDHNLDLDPWFRCLITKQPIPSVLRKWGDKARKQLESHELKIFIDGLRLKDGVELDVSRLQERIW